MTKNKVKTTELPMKFNPALNKYEPILPTKNSNKKLKVQIDWRWLIFPLVLLILFIIMIISITPK